MVFARGVDKGIWMKQQLEPNGQQWSTFSAFGGQLSSGPKAILNSEGFVHVFAKSWGDNTLMHKFQFAGENGTCWSDWASLGGALSSLPSPLLDCEGLILTCLFTLVPLAATEPASPTNTSNRMKNHPAMPKAKPMPALRDPDSPQYPKASIATVPSIKRQNMAGLISGCTAERIK